MRREAADELFDTKIKLLRRYFFFLNLLRMVLDEVRRLQMAI